MGPAGVREWGDVLHRQFSDVPSQSINSYIGIMASKSWYVINITHYLYTQLTISMHTVHPHSYSFSHIHKHSYTLYRFTGSALKTVRSSREPMLACQILPRREEGFLAQLVLNQAAQKSLGDETQVVWVKGIVKRELNLLVNNQLTVF